MAIFRYAGDRYTGLSTDIKPTNVLTGATFLETDTGAHHYWDGSTWASIGVGVTDADTLDGLDSTDFAQKAIDETISGNWTITNKLRLTSDTLISLTGDTHTFQTGPSSGYNISFANSTIQARNNGVAAGLALNLLGGSVTVNGSRVLTTNDEGAGNGLDADTVDGSHAYAFAAALHTHGGWDVRTLGWRLSVESDGKIRANNGNYCQAGMYGFFNSTKIAHIWSIGSNYAIDGNGATFGNLYGIAYKHTNNTTGGTMANGHQVVFCNNGTPKAAIGFNGNFWTSGVVQATGEITAYYSDERLKERVGHIDNALEKTLSLDTFKFTQNELAKSFGYDDDKVRIGVSAQQVQAILPEIVQRAVFDREEDENGNEYSKTGEDYLTLDYSKLVPLLIEAIKEQNNIINTQEDRITRLEAAVQTLTEKHDGEV